MSDFIYSLFPFRLCLTFIIEKHFCFFNVISTLPSEFHIHLVYQKKACKTSPKLGFEASRNCADLEADPRADVSELVTPWK